MDKLIKILVVDDEQVMRDALVEKLSSAGFSTIRAVDGIEGLEMAKKEHPDLILLDNAMPRMTGMEMMESLRKDSWGKTVPIIIFTSFDTNDEMLKQLAENAPTYYLVKGKVSPEEVLEKIREKLGI